MKTHAKRICAIVGSLALIDTGYSDTSAFELPDPTWGQPAARDSGILLASNLVFERIVTTQTSLIRHEATPRQRQVAVQHVTTYVKRLAPEKRVQLKKRKVRYIAVDTEKNKDTTPQAKKVVMIWDTHEEKLVGNDVYDLPDPPAVGVTTAFNSFTAEYVGAGN